VTPSAGFETSASWIGIDGWNNSSLIQVGTNQFTSGGTTTYNAWYELIPAPQSVIINAPVYPGDQIEAEIIQDTPGMWTIWIQDVGRWVASGPPISYPTPEQSAEWISERITVGGGLTTLANFGSEPFTHLGILAASAAPITPVWMLDNSGNILAYPGPYSSSNSSFTDYYGPPPPTVSSAWPAQGSTAGGTSVTISGTNLTTSASTVSFGNTPASFTKNPNGTLTAVAPPGSPGSVYVLVTTWTGTSAPVSAADVFTYITPPAVTAVLPGGTSLTSVGSLTSPNGQYQLVVQTDGNVVVYGPHGANWSSGSSGTRGDVLAMQSDGNLVLYSASGPIWWSGTSGTGGTEAVLQNDGNLVIYGPRGAVWSSLYGFSANVMSQGQSLGPNGFLLSPNGQYRAVLQSDGNMVVYGPAGPNWSTGTWGTGASLLILQGDGNLVLYGPRGAVWYSGTWGTGASELVMQNDGNLVLYGPSGAAWSSLYG
jgi:hypothetical protein